MAREEGLCRDCGARVAPSAPRCPTCRSPRLLRHPDLFQLSIAHVDCDAFFAAVEKRDDPSLIDKPVIIGGGRRGVVSTCCYVARVSGVRSAMPMFKALRLCPDAVVLKPDISKYVAVSREIRAKFDALTPLVEPLSLDEAFLDLSGTELLHRACPVESLTRLAAEIEAEIGVTVSIGLAPNKFLAKIASDLDKPRGFSVIGEGEKTSFLADQPVSIIWGVGATTSEKLAADGYRTVRDLQQADPDALFRRYGALGGRLARLAWGEDARDVSTNRRSKSVSAETTFETDVEGPHALEAPLWRLSERVSTRMKQANLSGRVVVLKLKTARFQTITRRATLSGPTQLAVDIFAEGQALLHRIQHSTPYRLIGIGLTDLRAADAACQNDSLFADEHDAKRRAETAIDALRAKFGQGAIQKGRGLR